MLRRQREAKGTHGIVRQGLPATGPPKGINEFFLLLYGPGPILSVVVVMRAAAMVVLDVR